MKKNIFTLLLVVFYALGMANSKICLEKDTAKTILKTTVIDSVKIPYENLSQKREKSITTRIKKNWFCVLWPNNETAFLILSKESEKKKFIKSVTLFPKGKNYQSGIIHFKILSNENGIPDRNNPILEFDTTFEQINTNNWEIILPRSVLIPNKGLFFDYVYKMDNPILKLPISEHNFFRMAANTETLQFWTQENRWKSIKVEGLKYKLKFLE